MSVRRLAKDQPESFVFQPETLKTAQWWIAKYPKGREQSAVIPILWLIQKQEGWISEPAIRLLAQMLNMAVIDVRAIQSKETKDQTDFVVVFEKIRVAGSATITPGQMANRAAISAAQTTTNPGALTPTPGPVTASVFSLFNMGGL